ncbi:MAG: hypothetical protein ABJB86_06475 [Bacteroidota bacterium]
MIPDEEDQTNQDEQASENDITKDPFYLELISMPLLPSGELDLNRLGNQSTNKLKKPPG